MYNKYILFIYIYTYIKPWNTTARKNNEIMFSAATRMGHTRSPNLTITQYIHIKKLHMYSLSVQKFL